MSNKNLLSNLSEQNESQTREVVFEDGAIAHNFRRPGASVAVSGLLGGPEERNMLGSAGTPDEVLLRTQSGTLYYIGYDGTLLRLSQDEEGGMVASLVDTNKYKQGVSNGENSDIVKATVGERLTIPGVMSTSPVGDITVLFLTRRAVDPDPSKPKNPFEGARALADELKEQRRVKGSLGRAAIRH